MTDLREQFEKWALLRKRKRPLDLSEFGDGTYVSNFATALYDAYQAGAESSSQELRRLRAELDKCGKENCMGYEVEGCKRWVSEERLLAAEAELPRLRQALRRP